MATDSGSSSVATSAHSALAAIRTAALDALAIVAPVRCVACNTPDRLLCESCRDVLRAAHPACEWFDLADTSTYADDDDELAFARMPRPRARRAVAQVPLATAFDYRDVARSTLVAFKDAGATSLRRTLGPALAEAARVCRSRVEASTRVTPALSWVSVPSTARAFGTRGYRPVELLAASAGLRTERWLRAANRSRDQVGLGRIERATNRRGVFRVSARGARRIDRIRSSSLGADVAVVLIDDIVTSGSTVRACAAALRVHGVQVVGVVAVARTRLRSELDSTTTR